MSSQAVAYILKETPSSIITSASGAVLRNSESISRTTKCVDLLCMMSLEWRRVIYRLGILFVVSACFLGYNQKASSCTDSDMDGYCAGQDCDDSNPFITGNRDDLDKDGVSECQGDCDDSDRTIQRCSFSKKKYPIIYNPPDQPCRSGLIVDVTYWRCQDTGTPGTPGYTCTTVGGDSYTVMADCYW